jgi:hypothetical protein
MAIPLRRGVAMTPGEIRALVSLLTTLGEPLDAIARLLSKHDVPDAQLRATNLDVGGRP